MGTEKSFLELRLYDNGIDFINKSMESFIKAKHNPIEYKYSILLLATGCELILKSILEDEHPLFVRENLDNSNEKTVKSENLVSRVNKVYSYQDSKKRIRTEDKNNLNSIREVRNNIIHKEVKFEDESIPQKLYANTLFTLDSIVKEFKEITLSTTVNNWAYIADIKHIQNAYYRKAKGIELNGISVPCPFCSIKKLVNKHNRIECLHCGNHFDSIPDAINALDDVDLREELFIAFAVEKVKDGAVFMDCPHCNEVDVAWYEENEDSINCFKCGTVNSEECPKCNKNSVVRYQYHLGNDFEKANYCFHCRENPYAKMCPGCSGEIFELKEKLRVDVIDQEEFKYHFDNLNYTADSPFINVSLCPECTQLIEELQDNNIVDIL